MFGLIVSIQQCFYEVRAHHDLSCVLADFRSQQGAPLVFLREFAPEPYLSTIAKYKCTVRLLLALSVCIPLTLPPVDRLHRTTHPRLPFNLPQPPRPRPQLTLAPLFRRRAPLFSTRPQRPSPMEETLRHRDGCYEWLRDDRD